MGNCGDERPLILANLEHLHHKGNRVVLFEPICHLLRKYRGCEWPKRLTPFNLAVKNGLHICPPRVAHDGAVAKCTRAPLHTTLKPSNHLAICYCCCGTSTQLLFIWNMLN